MQLSWMIRFAGISYNFGTHMGFDLPTDYFFGDFMFHILIIQLCVVGFLLLVLIYIFPIKIATDSEHPRSWLYPCKPSEWKEGAKHVDHEHDDDYAAAVTNEDVINAQDDMMQSAGSINNDRTGSINDFGVDQ